MDKLGYPGDLGTLVSQEPFGIGHRFFPISGYPGDLAFYISRTIFLFLNQTCLRGGGLCAFGARSSTLAILRSNAAARTARIHQGFLKFRVPWRSWVHGWNPGDLSKFMRILGISGSGDLLARSSASGLTVPVGAWRRSRKRGVEASVES